MYEFRFVSCVKIRKWVCHGCLLILQDWIKQLAVLLTLSHDAAVAQPNGVVRPEEGGAAQQDLDRQDGGRPRVEG